MTAGRWCWRCNAGVQRKLSDEVFGHLEWRKPCPCGDKERQSRCKCGHGRPERESVWEPPRLRNDRGRSVLLGVDEAGES